MVTIQYVSDLHLEFNFIDDVLTPSAEVLVLAGDICAVAGSDYKYFLAFLNRYHDKFDLILHVAGNHEYYNHEELVLRKRTLTIPVTESRLRELTKEYPNYHFLQNEIFIYKNVRFFGTTLWSFIPKAHYKMIKNRINDYRSIIVRNECNDIRYINPEDTVKLHEEAVESILNNEIDVLITHHKPVWDDNEKYNYTQYGFQTDLKYALKPPIQLVIYGHTHEKYDKMIGNVHIVSNPRGYEYEHIDFDAQSKVSISRK